ncbi:MAG: glycosyltransferase [Bryobacteraceae bacterium]
MNESSTHSKGDWASSQLLAEEMAQNGRLKVLTLSWVFPNPNERDLGLFVQRRMAEVGRMADVRVIAPVAVLEYGNPNRKFAKLTGIPEKRIDGPLEIWHPRWLYPPMGGGWNAVALFLQVWRTAARIRREFEFDVIDAHFGHPEGVAAALLAWATGKPFAVTLRGIEPEHAVHPFRRFLLRWSFRRASAVISVSARLRDFALSLGADPDTAFTVPNGIDSSLFRPENREAVRREFDIQPGEKIILTAGHLLENKGHHRVAEVLAKLRHRGLAVRQFIAGGPGRGGVYQPELERLIESYGVKDQVRMLGAVAPDKLAKLMVAADVFCLASRAEGWPNVVHEAMASGTPVVATNVGAIPEMIPSEMFGYIVPFGQPRMLEEALWRALTQDWDRKMIAAWGQARSWEKVAAEVVEILERAAGKHSERIE